MTSLARQFEILNLSSSQTAARRLIVQALYREHSARLVQYAVERVRDEDAAEDIVQEAFASMIDGRFSVPAVDVGRKLEAVVRFHCSAHRKESANRETTKCALQRARQQPDDDGWRAYRKGLRDRRHVRDDEGEDQ